MFRSRFTSVEIANDDQLLTTVRYVHRNPLELDPAMDLAGYRWSSHAAFLRWAPAPPWLAHELATRQFLTREQFQDFVETSLPSDAVQSNRRSVAPSQLYEPQFGHQSCSLADVQRAVAHAAGVDVRVLASPTGRDAKRARQVALVLCADELSIESNQLADAMGFASAGAAATALSRARKLLSTSSEFESLVRRSRQHLKM